MFSARRRVARNVHDGGPEKVLRRDEEDGEEETGEGNPQTSGDISLLIIVGWVGVRKNEGKGLFLKGT